MDDGHHHTLITSFHPTSGLHDPHSDRGTFPLEFKVHPDTCLPGQKRPDMCQPDTFYPDKHKHLHHQEDNGASKPKQNGQQTNRQKSDL